METVETRTTPAATGRLAVDFPRQNEVIRTRQYTLRLSAPEAARKVEVCIDQGEWRECRPAVGYWWHDWTGYEGGEHEVITRLETPEGLTIASEPHEFFVDFRAAA